MYSKMRALRAAAFLSCTLVTLASLVTATYSDPDSDPDYCNSRWTTCIQQAKEGIPFCDAFEVPASIRCCCGGYYLSKGKSDRSETDHIYSACNAGQYACPRKDFACDQNLDCKLPPAP